MSHDDCPLRFPMVRSSSSADELLRSRSASDGPWIVAHRGASSVAPENTLPAFALAARAGADIIEFDYRVSADGEMVVIHDETLARTTDALLRWGDGDVAVANQSKARLTSLDAGSWYDPRYAGAQLPTLASALDVILPFALPLIERKAGDAESLASFLERRDLTRSVIVQSFDWEFLADLRLRLPQLPLGVLGLRPLAENNVDRLDAIQPTMLAWKHDDLTPDHVRWANARSCQLFAWTVNDPGRARELVDWGVAGLITDAPGVIATQFLGLSLAG